MVFKSIPTLVLFACLTAAAAQNAEQVIQIPTEAVTPSSTAPTEVVQPAPTPDVVPQAQAHSQSNPEPTQTSPTATQVDPTPTQVSAEELAVPVETQTTPPENESRAHIHEVVRRIVVFPLETQGNYKKEAELAWWKIRDSLSDYQRFLVATKRFLTQKEAFQPRGLLKISDVILLAQILESDNLVTTYIENNKLTMSAYSGQDGLLLWKKSLSFNSSKPISQQLEELSEKLIKDYIATIPYHGFQIVDPLVGKPVIEEGSTLIAKIDVGAKSTIAAGEKVQWLEIERINTQPLFLGGSKYTVYAEGTVVKNENQVLTVEIKRFVSLDKLQKRSLILSAEESKRLISQYGIRDTSKPEAPISLVQGELRSASDHNSEKKSLFTALAAILNIVVVILLAF